MHSWLSWVWSSLHLGDWGHDSHVVQLPGGHPSSFRAGCLGSGPAFTWATGAMTSVLCSAAGWYRCIFGFCWPVPATHGHFSSCRAGCLGSGPAFTWATGAMTSPCSAAAGWYRTSSSFRVGCLGSGPAFTWATGAMTSVFYS
jgi:hypothetical protein